jgi:cellulose synthase (UDP-forming)
MAKGAFELAEFGVEQDAYVFNLAWSGLNLLFLVGGLMIAWERPQRREEERVRRALPVQLQVSDAAGEGTSSSEAWTFDVGIGGCALLLDRPVDLPNVFDLELGLEKPLRLRAQLAYQERMSGRTRVGLRFVDRSEEQTHALLIGIFADPKTWDDAHARQSRSYLGAVLSFAVAMAGFFRSLRRTRRHHPRRLAFSRIRARMAGAERRGWLRDRSPRGLGLVLRGEAPRVDGLWRVACANQTVRFGRAIYVRRWAFFFWRIGIEFVAEPGNAGKGVDELAIS